MRGLLLLLAVVLAACGGSGATADGPDRDRFGYRVGSDPNRETMLLRPATDSTRYLVYPAVVDSVAVRPARAAAARRRRRGRGPDPGRPARRLRRAHRRLAVAREPLRDGRPADAPAARDGLRGRRPPVPVLPRARRRRTRRGATRSGSTGPRSRSRCCPRGPPRPTMRADWRLAAAGRGLGWARGRPGRLRHARPGRRRHAGPAGDVADGSAVPPGPRSGRRRGRRAGRAARLVGRALGGPAVRRRRRRVLGEPVRARPARPRRARGRGRRSAAWPSWLAGARWQSRSGVRRDRLDGGAEPVAPPVRVASTPCPRRTGS